METFESNLNKEYIDLDMKRTSKLFLDASKMTFALPQYLLEIINLWPMKQNVWTKFGFYIKFLLILMLETGQVIYLVLNITDIKKISAIISTVSTTFQAIIKISIIFVHSARLKSVINIAYNEFWPSDFLGKDLERTLKTTSIFVLFNMCSVMCSAMIFALGFLTKPLAAGTMNLPFESWYPFNWQISPLYELIYILQTFINIYIVVISILGHDFFLLALCRNVISQYQLLKRVMGCLGDENNEELNGILSGFGLDCKPIFGPDSQERMLIVKCVVHHNKLLKICNEIEYIFSASIFAQLATSVTAICVSTFLISAVEIDMDQLYQLTSYCLGHVLQLFLICAAGNEVSYQSQSLNTNVYNNNWHLKTDLDIRKSLMMIMRRCLRGTNITALGIFDLNYTTFVSVMRLSFSMYTLLSNIIEKKQI